MRKEATERPDRKTDRKADRIAAQREAAGRRKRVRTLRRFGIIALVIAAAAALGYRFYTERQLLAAVTTASYAAGVHVPGRFEYAESPPIGGPHNVAWQNCGIYNEPIHNEHAVHSLEHGAVWITYRSDLPADQVQQLRTAAADDYVLLSPFPGLSSPVVVSAWNHQIRLEGAADPRLPAFIAEYKNNPSTTPEFGASCYGAINTTAAAATLQ